MQTIAAILMFCFILLIVGIGLHAGRDKPDARATGRDSHSEP